MHINQKAKDELTISKILPLKAEYLPEQLFGPWGAVEMDFRVISGSREIFCTAWLSREIEISKVKGSPIDSAVFADMLLKDEKFSVFVIQQLMALEQSLYGKEAKDIYFKTIFLPHAEFEKYVLERFKVLKETYQIIQEYDSQTTNL